MPVHNRSAADCRCRPSNRNRARIYRMRNRPCDMYLQKKKGKKSSTCCTRIQTRVYPYGSPCRGCDPRCGCD
ncbi:hypothetical protein [Pandoravirus japonicus]|uniref:Uncharacterized protein n=1 Tax=Pandoravirus japonicus TaxID=2823154 RepID=A0A811BRA7_9VIRU|nr:hypothetical protein [Pandoravirus japonicus]